MKRFLFAVLAGCLALAAGAAQAAPMSLGEATSALQRRDVAALERAAADEALIAQVAAIDPQAAIGMLLDIADALAAKGRTASALAAADRAVVLSETTWGGDSLEMVEPLRRLAVLQLRTDPQAASASLSRALANVRRATGGDLGPYAELEVLQRQAWDLSHIHI